MPTIATNSVVLPRLIRHKRVNIASNDISLDHIASLAIIATHNAY